MEIKPLVPTWPSRAVGKAKKEKERPDSEQKDAEETKNKNKNSEDGTPHVDEFA